MQQHAGRRVLEGELVQAVVGDRQADQEREPARDPVQRAQPRRRGADAAAGRTATAREPSWTSANSTARVASQTFIVIVSANPSVIDRSLAGSWTLP